jgi:ribosomal protein S12 methylthiotransferase accessory factor
MCPLSLQPLMYVFAAIARVAVVAAAVVRQVAALASPVAAVAVAVAVPAETVWAKVVSEKGAAIVDSAQRLRDTLAQNPGGLITKIRTGWSDLGELPLMVASAVALGGALSPLDGWSPFHQGSQLAGGGVGLTAEEALVPALAEAVERHAASTFYDDQFLWASSECIDRPMLDLDIVARCSQTELAHPSCSLRLPSKKEPIRWVQGLSLNDGQPLLVPVVMIYTHAGWRGPQERFWLPISTGCAAHCSYEEALLTGICEVVERDAISLIWRQRMGLPLISIDALTPKSAPFWELYQRGSADVEFHFFDATTDVGLPTIYGIQVSRNHPHAYTTVACSTALSYDDALIKVIKDFVSFKRAFGTRRKLPVDTASFTGLMDGAAYMAAPERAYAFEFLLNSRRSTTLSALRAKSLSKMSLRALIQRLSKLRMQIVAVDLTTDEAHRAGLRVVRVVIPALQPLSFHTSAQYLAHPRLYTAPGLMGYPVFDEADLNQWPQPFA